jgi:hypothetical protein
MPENSNITDTKDNQPEEIICLNIAETKITFYDAKGNPLTKNSKELAMNTRFKIEGPGINPERVTKIILPPLNYTTPQPYTIEIHTLPHLPDTENTTQGKAQPNTTG